jgi:hypothetical protein
MKKINLRSLLIAGIIGAITFIILELIIESAFFKLFHISESVYFEKFNIQPAGFRFHILNYIIFFLEMILIMYVYALIRPGFKSNISAGIVTSFLFLGIVFLLFSNFTNLGIFTPAMSLTSFLFNILELPPAVLMGAILYGEG